MKCVVAIAAALTLAGTTSIAGETPTGVIIATNKAAPCNDIAARLREQADLLSAKRDLRPIQLLSGGPNPLVELASGSDGASVSNEEGIREWKKIDRKFGNVSPEKPPVDQNDYAAAFDKRFAPNSQLADDVAKLTPFQYDEIETLRNGPVHALTAAGGSANCVTFLFFETSSNGRSHLLPDPPPAMDGGMEPDVGPHRTECYASAGYLATIHDQAAFVVADYAPTGFDSDLRVATFENGVWSHGCLVKIGFQTKYSVSKMYVADRGPVSRDELLQVAPQLALAMDSAASNLSQLWYGLPIPLSERTHVSRMIEAARNGHAQSENNVHVPKSDNWGNFGIPTSGIVLDPITLRKTPYLITIEHPLFGWRDEPGYSLVIYQIGAAKLSMIAVAEISAERGALKAIHVASDMGK